MNRTTYLAPPPFDEGGVLPTDENKTVMDHPVIYPFLQRLEGYKTNLKGHHWHGYNNSAHVRIDELLGTVSELQDTIAEVASAIYGIMPLGFTGVPVEYHYIINLIDDIIHDAIQVRTDLDGDSRHFGLINALEDFLQRADTMKYLVELSLKG